MTKRCLFVLMAVVALCLAASRAFASGQPPSEPVTLSIIDNYTSDDPKGKVKEEVFAAFMQKYPDIKIEDQVFKDLDIPTKVEVAYVAGKEPDVVFVNYFLTTFDWLKNGIVLPVNDYIKRWGLEGKLVEGGLITFTEADGRIASFPFEGYNWPIWYNMKIGKAAGIDRIPTTMDELLADIPKIRQAGFEPYVTAGNDGESHQEFDMFVMAFLTPDEVKKVFHDGDWSVPGAVKGVKLFVQMRDAGLFSKDTPGLTNQTKPEAYFKGNVFMQHGGSWAYSTTPDGMLADITLGGFPLPAGSTYAHPFWQVSFTGKGVWVTRNGAKKEDAVRKFVTFLYTPENIKKFVVQSSMISPLKGIDLAGETLNPLFVQSMKLDNLSVMTMPDPVIPSNVNLISLTKQFYLPGASGMSAEKMLDALTKLWAQAKQ